MRIVTLFVENVVLAQAHFLWYRKCVSVLCSQLQLLNVYHFL